MQIKGYTISEQINRTGKSRVFRATEEETGKKVILKSPERSKDPGYMSKRIRHDYQIGANLNHAGVLKYLRLIYHEGLPVLVMEDTGGESLDQYSGIKKLTIREFLSIAIQCTETLHYLFNQHIIHCDLKPGNIIIEPENKHIHIIDFGAATVLENRSVFINLEVEPEFTLKYVSPEQTGRTSRNMDYRTDFYSLGITFYELLIGSVPFDSENPAELVHAHLARNPVDPSQINKEIPPALSKIILKMMCKVAEDRYQSAQGLLNDLKWVQSHLEQPENLAGFIPGQNDFSPHFKLSKKIFGREEETESLLHLFAHQPEGNNGIVLVTGHSGVGKTTLIKELYEPLLRQQGYLVAGKYEQFTRDIPFLALKQALTSFLRILLTEKDEQIEKWKQIFMQAMPNSAFQIAEKIPEFSFFISQDDKEKSAFRDYDFVETLITLVKTISRNVSRLTVFIDDLQWADMASIKLLKSLLTDEDLQNFFFIGSYRDNEVNEEHPLLGAVKYLGEFKTVTTLSLKNLSEQDTRKMVVANLHCSEEKGREIGKTIYSKTQGNPFYINTLLEVMFKQGILTADEKMKAWQWNQEELNKLAVSENVADLLVTQMQQLSPEMIRLLKVASCAGSVFDAEKISWNLNLSRQELGHLLESVCQMNFAFPIIDKNLRPETDDQLNSYVDVIPLREYRYKFLHDKVQQAAYQMASEKEKNEIHFQCGFNLYQSYPNRRSELCFEIVNHLNQAISLLTNNDQKLQVAEMNALAGKMAFQAAAFDSAFHYFGHSLNLFGELGGWEHHQDKVFEIALSRGEAAQAMHQTDIAMDIADHLFLKAVNQTQKLRIYFLKVVILTKKGELNAVEETTFEALADFGYKLSRNKISLMMKLLREIVISRFYIKKAVTNDKIILPWATDELHIRLMLFLVNSMYSVYQSNSELYAVLAMKTLNISLKHGRSELTSQSIIGYALILTFGLKDKSAIAKYGKVALKEGRLSTPREKFNAEYVYYVVVKHWLEKPGDQIDDLIDISNQGIELGISALSGYALCQHFFSKLYISTNLEQLVGLGSDHIRLLSRRENPGAIAMIQGRYAQVLALTGNTAGLTNLNCQWVDEETIIPFYEKYSVSSPLGFYLCAKINVLMHAQKYHEALPFIARVPKVFPFLIGLLASVEISLYSGICLLHLARESDGSEKRKHLSNAKFYLDNLKFFASIHQENYLPLYLLLHAEMKFAKGSRDSAEAGYKQAIQLLRESENLQFTALACELYSRFCNKTGKQDQAKTLLAESYELYKNWGAIAITRLMEEQHPELVIQAKTPLSALHTQTGTGSISGQHTRIGEALDLNAILNASQTLSGEILIDNLLKKMISILTQNTGAQKAYLLLRMDNGFRVRAKYNIAQSEAELLDEPLNEYPELPLTQIQYVVRTKQVLVKDDASKNESGNEDRYFMENKPLSVLCYPIQKQGELNGILYLENNIITGAFSGDRLHMVELLAGQISVSLENALLYQNLDNKVRERTAELNNEKQKSDNLLKNILPEEVAEELKQKGKAEAKQYQNVTVLFTDFVNFTGISEELSPKELVEEIHRNFTAFDEIIERNGLEKIKTIGDAYLAVCGMPHESTDHAQRVARAAIEIRDFMETYPGKFQVRIGLHSGPVVAGIVGVKKYAYDIWGDTVNMAARMEQTSEAGKINCSGITFELLKDTFICANRGKINAKNKGEVEMYFVNEENKGREVGK